MHDSLATKADVSIHHVIPAHPHAFGKIYIFNIFFFSSDTHLKCHLTIGPIRYESLEFMPFYCE